MSRTVHTGLGCPKPKRAPECKHPGVQALIQAGPAPKSLATKPFFQAGSAKRLE